MPDIAAFATEVEKQGFHGLWTRDHLRWRLPVVEPLLLLAVAATATTTLRIGTGVYLAGLRSPFQTARNFADIDVLSEGRLDFGVGVGAGYEPDHVAADVPKAQRGRRLDASLAAIRALWGGETVAGSALDVRPRQQPAPPVWVGGKSDAALRRAAHHADGWIATLVSPDGYARRLDVLAGYGAEAGRGGVPRAALVAYVCVDDSTRRATDRMRQAIVKDLGAGADDIVMKLAACGPAEQCAEVLAPYIASGVDHLILLPPFGMDQAAVDQVGRLASELVAPLSRQ
jgi:alkanesulfonate monooxygenase SsuD/methylene tetrahydromethanopterin reductase-like flavin-dependent oxidoreductase (luciferase family)